MYCSKHQFVLQLKKWNRRRYKSSSQGRGTRETTTDSEASIPAKMGAFSNEPFDADIPRLPLSTVDEEFEAHRDFASGSELGAALDSFIEALHPQSSASELHVTPKTIMDDATELNNIGNTEAEITPIWIEERNSSRSSDLRRVPRAKRRRSTSTNDSASSFRKRQKYDCLTLMDPTTENVWDTLLSVQDAPATFPAFAEGHSVQISSRPDLENTDATPSAEWTDQDWTIRSLSPSTQTIAEDSATQDLQSEESNRLKNLLQFAEQGSSSHAFSYTHIREIQHLAGFFFGATLYEEAFLLYMLVYRTLKTAAHASNDVLLPILINLARSSTTEAQDEIVRSLLLQALRKRHRQSTGEPHENFLINAFLTIIFRRQKELSKADHHCHRAIHCLDQPPAASSGKVMNSWRSLSVVACTKLEFNITQKRLLLNKSGICTDARRKICSRASDQLITALQSYLKSESSTVENACVVVGPDVLFNYYDRPFIAQPRALRSLYEWCLQVLESTSTQFDSRQPWRTFRAKGMKLRAIGITTLYCQLWRHWRSECGELLLVSTVSDYWSVGIEEQLGIPANECLAAIPETLAVAWPFDDESMPMLANWRTYLAELRTRAVHGLKTLLEQTDITLAHFFLQAYSARCIPEPNPDDLQWSSPRTVHRECVLAFAMDHIDLDLPGFGAQSHTQNPSEMLNTSTFLGQGSSFVIPTTASTTDLSGPRTDTTTGPIIRESSEIPDPPSVKRADELAPLSPASAAGPSNENGRTFARTGDSKSSHKSIKTVSTDLASMVSLKQRTNYAKTKAREENILEPPSTAMSNVLDVDMSLDSIMGLARNSMESLSLHGSIYEHEMNDAGSMTRLLNSSSSQIDVVVS